MDGKGKAAQAKRKAEAGTAGWDGEDERDATALTPSPSPIGWARVASDTPAPASEKQCLFLLVFVAVADRMGPDFASEDRGVSR